MAHYHLVSEWHLDAPVDVVWDALLRSAEWPAWWRGIRSVEQLDAGAESGAGMRLRQRWRSLLPCTLTLDLEILRVEQRRLLVGRTSGDLAGTCAFSFEEEGSGTSVRFEMDVRPTRAWMNLPLPFADRVAAMNHDAIMRWGGEGLTRRLDRRAPEGTAAGRLAGA